MLATFKKGKNCKKGLKMNKLDEIIFHLLRNMSVAILFGRDLQGMVNRDRRELNVKIHSSR